MLWRISRNRVLVILAAMLGDALATNVALFPIYWWVRTLNIEVQAQLDSTPWSGVALFVIVLNLALFGTYLVAGMYTLPRGVSRIDEGFKVIPMVTTGVGIAYVTNLLLPQFGFVDIPLPSVLLIGGWFFILMATLSARFCYRSTLSALRRRDIDIRRVLIIGALEPGQLVYRALVRDPSLGYRVIGFASDARPIGTLVYQAPVLCTFEQIGATITAHDIDLVIVALSGRASHELFDIIMRAEDAHVEVKLYPDAYTLITNNVVSDNDIIGLPLLNVRNGALANPFNQALKRVFDFVFASAVLLVASPIMILIAILIKLESPGPAFFVQPRVGTDGEPFPTIKFRTMRVDAAQLANWTTKDDPRRTRIGTFLRKTSLDELPNFINVIRGEMSVVGPRPEQEVWVERFKQEIPYYMRRHRQKVGITGWAQANGLRGDTSIEDRTRYDLYYVENWSLLFDIKICIRTFVDIVTGRNKGY
ncbi:MAG: undecaprenyl-phosphate glucose phosphotransferase [Roseiflexaceae bacterium]|jgi:exopolysaccharide biosynthesis polyprenyl glycosylphosphotransferase|nr:undecaprenyl-phosphate glucose phosphotransferase [Chloroflexaceae bacterium]